MNEASHFKALRIPHKGDTASKTMLIITEAKPLLPSGTVIKLMNA